MTEQDVVLAVGFRDQGRPKQPGDLACGLAIARLMHEVRRQMVYAAADLLVQHQQQQNGHLIAQAAAMIGAHPLVLVGMVAVRRELVSRPRDQPAGA